jgi:type II secretory pathway pseudopilin PulG
LGYSLIEMLSVISIIALFGAISLPSMMSLTKQAGRKAAVNQLLNTFERARTLALETGFNTHVVFVNNTGPDEFKFRAYMVLRDVAENETPDVVGGATKAVTKWEVLPRGISMKSERKSLVGTDNKNEIVVPKTALFPFANVKLPALTFNSSGSINAPGKDALQMFIYEGFFANNQDNFIRQQTGGAPLFEKFTLSRFTGKAQLDVTSL